MTVFRCAEWYGAQILGYRMVSRSLRGICFFWLWVAWREQSVAKSILWFILIMTLGNIAMAAYVLAQLRHIRS